jgi:aryl-alcohol dehydrogenase-like predicted oxidoreductase
MDEAHLRTLGRTGLKVGRLGVASGYGAPAAAFEEAFDRGVNYFYWGSLRRRAMAEAIRHINARGQGDRLVILIQSYSRSPLLMERFFHQALRRLRLDHADILLLGWHNRPPSERLLERAVAMQAKGMFRFLGISGHHRPLFAELAADETYDLFHVRYNAVHRGAETEVFDRLSQIGRPGVVTYTATRWGDLLDPRKMPAGEAPCSAADCYRFVLSQPSVDVCMTGPKNIAQMRDALTALDSGPLPAETLAGMRRIGDYLHDHHKRLFS